MVKLTFFFELLSRGLLWLRLLLIVLIIPDSSYSLVVLLVTAEALIGNVIAFPQIREVLVDPTLSSNALTKAVMFWLVTLPVQYIASLIYFDSNMAAMIVVICSLSFSINQIFIYMLRVVSVSSHNLAKITSAFLSGSLFFVLVPINPYFYVIAALVAPTAPGLMVLRKLGPSFFKVQMPNISETWNGWVHYSVQSLGAVFWMYGNRFVVGAVFSATTMASFMKSYLLTSGITFIYSAVMIVWERPISIKINKEELPNRLRTALKVFSLLFLSWIAYSSVLFSFFIFRPVHLRYVDKLLAGIDPILLLLFFVLFLVRALQLAISPVVIAVERKGFVTGASVASIFIQVALFALLWKSMTPLLVGGIMLLSLGAAVIISAFGLVIRAAREEVSL